ncbi:MAG: hypothetical protein RLZZ546_2381 [Bacteroidota bacterium]|jgi:hypothetical protein
MYYKRASKVFEGRLIACLVSNLSDQEKHDRIDSRSLLSNLNVF